MRKWGVFKDSLININNNALNASRVNHSSPEFIRLPRQGVPCEWTGMSRGKMVQLILPSKENGFSPPVKSVSLGPSKRSKGWTRLVHFKSLMNFLNAKL
mgnify:FL=1